MATNQLSLEPITRSNWRSTLEVKTTPDQLLFVADYEPIALVILAKSYVNADGKEWRPLAIKETDNVVGVVAVAQHANECEIFHLVIDQEFQGRGIGKASVKLLLDYIRREVPDCKKVSLTVHPDNERARHIYQTSGFHDSGRNRYSEPVLELAL